MGSVIAGTKDASGPVLEALVGEQKSPMQSKFVVQDVPSHSWYVAAATPQGVSSLHYAGDALRDKIPNCIEAIVHSVPSRGAGDAAADAMATLVLSKPTAYSEIKPILDAQFPGCTLKRQYVRHVDKLMQAAYGHGDSIAAGFHAMVDHAVLKLAAGAKTVTLTNPIHQELRCLQAAVDAVQRAGPRKAGKKGQPKLKVSKEDDEDEAEEE